jgi:hypothetical protein
MAQQNEDDKNFPPDTQSGSTDEKDFGRTDRYANKDDEKNFNFTTTGDGTAWDSGRTSSITDGTRVEKDLHEGDAEAPGVNGPKPNR